MAKTANRYEPLCMRSVQTVLLLGLVAGSTAAGEPVLSTFLEAQGRDWREWRNWDTGVIPNNTLTESYVVVIPEFRRAELDWFGTTEVTSLTLGRNTSVLVLDGVFRPGAVSFGENSVLQAAGGDIELTDPGGDWSRGKVIAQYDSTVTSALDRIDNCVVLTLQANTPGTLVDFSSLLLVRGDADASLNATAVGGVVDLTGLTTLDIPSSWSARDGGTITAGAFSGSRIRSITIDPASLVSLPGVVSLNEAEIRLHGDAHLQTGVLVSIDNVNMIVDDGAHVVFPVTQIMNTGVNGTNLQASNAWLGFPDLTRIETIPEAGTVRLSAPNGTLSLERLTEIVGSGTVRIEVNSDSVQIPQLARIEPTLFLLTGGTQAFGDIAFGPIAVFTIGDGDVSFAGAVDLTGTDIRISGNSQVSFSTLDSLDNARIEISGQSVFAPQLSSITLDDPAVIEAPWKVYEDALLDLSAVSAINVTPDAGPESRITLDVRNNGQIVLGPADITVDPASYISFSVHGPDAAITLSQVASINGPSSWSVDGGGTLVTPPSLVFDNARSIYLGGGTLHLLGLQSLDEAAIGISQDTQFAIGGTVDTLHNTSVNASRNWSIPGTSLAWTRSGNQTVFKAYRCVLTAPALQAMDFTPSPLEDQATLLIEANMNSLLDLSAVRSLHGPPHGSGHALRVQTARNDGVLDLSGVETATGVIKLDAYGYNGVLYWGADILMEASHDNLSGSSLRIWNGGRLVCGGSITTTLTGLEVPSISDGVLEFRSDDTESLEVFMFDHVFGFDPQGRKIQQLTVGSPASPTRLAMIDAEDNGNRGEKGEAMYLGDSSAPALESALTISEGSSLVLNGLAIYVEAQGQQVRLGDLFPENQRAFAFGDGTLYRVDPDLCPADFSAPFGMLDFFDAQAFLTLFSNSDPEADLSQDGLFDFFDVLAFLESFSGGCP
jgi:hypothetical protein